MCVRVRVLAWVWVCKRVCVRARVQPPDAAARQIDIPAVRETDYRSRRSIRVGVFHGPPPPPAATVLRARTARVVCKQPAARQHLTYGGAHSTYYYFVRDVVTVRACVYYIRNIGYTSHTHAHTHTSRVFETNVLYGNVLCTPWNKCRPRIAYTPNTILLHHPVHTKTDRKPRSRVSARFFRIDRCLWLLQILFALWSIWSTYNINGSLGRNIVICALGTKHEQYCVSRF